MSRINRARIVDGDQTTAASLNDRFDDFSQSGALDRFNLRDASIDLPQLSATAIKQAPFVQIDDIGKTDLLHASPRTVTASTVSPYTSLHIIQDGAGTPTIANYGLGLTIDPDEVLRIYWSLSVNAEITGTPYEAGIQALEIKDIPSGGPSTTVSTSAGCFVAWLQWDITSASRTNFVEVPGQGDFKTTHGSYFGNALSFCPATTVIPLWSVWAPDMADGEINFTTARAMGWRGVSGAWHYAPTSSVTVYGLRIVVLGVMHPRRVSTATANNLVLDTAAATGTTFEYTGGRLVTFVNRVK